MPTYEYGCNECRIKFEQIHAMSENPSFPCPKCGGPTERLISLNTSGFFVKGGTETTHWREKRVRMKKREELGVKQEKHRQAMPKVRPNIAGVEVDTWGDAQKMAKEAGLNHESFTPWVEKENKGRIKIATS